MGIDWAGPIHLLLSRYQLNYLFCFSYQLDSTVENKFGPKHFSMLSFAEILVKYSSVYTGIYLSIYSIKCVKYRMKVSVLENNSFTLKLHFNNLIFQEKAYFCLHDLEE